MNIRPQTPALTPQLWISLFLSNFIQTAFCVLGVGGENQLSQIYLSISAFVFVRVQMIVRDEPWEKKNHVTDKNIIIL